MKKKKSKMKNTSIRLTTKRRNGRKVTKLQKIQRFLSDSRRRPLLFVLIFAIVGTALLIRTFARDPNAPVDGSKEVVFEYVNENAHGPEGLAVSSEGLPEGGFTGALLLGDGRLFCEDNPDLNPVAIKTGRVNKARIVEFVNQVKQAGFLNLDHVLSPTGDAMSHTGETFTLQLNGGVRTVYLQGVETPTELTKTRSLVLDLCQAVATDQYYPEKANVIAAQANQARLNELKAGEVDRSQRRDAKEIARGLKDTEQLLNTVKSGSDRSAGRKNVTNRNELRDLVDRLKSSPSRVLEVDGVAVEVAVAAYLPEYRPVIENEKNSLSAAPERSFFAKLLSLAKVSAGHKRSHTSKTDPSTGGGGSTTTTSTKVVEFYWFHAADENLYTNWSSALSAHAMEVKAFYERQTGKKLEVVVRGAYRGQKTRAEYGTTGGAWHQALHAEVPVTTSSIPVYVSQSAPWPTIYPNEDGNTVYRCGGGLAFQYENSLANPNGIRTLALTFGAQACAASNQRWGFTTSAHEIGHSLGLTHENYSGSFMSEHAGYASADCVNFTAACHIEANQKNALIAYSPYLTSGTVTTAPAQLTVSQSVLSGFPNAGATVNPGQEIGIRVSFSNPGSVATPNTVIENATPAGTNAIWQGGIAVNGASGLSQGNSGTSPITYFWWKMSNLSPGGWGYVDMRFRISSNAQAGSQVCNTASIRADNFAKIFTQNPQLCFTVGSTTTVTSCTKQINFNNLAAPAVPADQYVQSTYPSTGGRRDYYYHYYGPGTFAAHQITSISPAPPAGSYTHSDPSGYHGILMNYANYFNTYRAPYQPTINYYYLYNYYGELWVNIFDAYGNHTNWPGQRSSGDGPGGQVTDQLTNTAQRAAYGSVTGPYVSPPCN